MALFGRASARDYAGHGADAEALYRRALSAVVGGQFSAATWYEMLGTAQLVAGSFFFLGAGRARTWARWP